MQFEFFCFTPPFLHTEPTVFFSVLSQKRGKNYRLSGDDFFADIISSINFSGIALKETTRYILQVPDTHGPALDCDYKFSNLVLRILFFVLC